MNGLLARLTDGRTRRPSQRAGDNGNGVLALETALNPTGRLKRITVIPSAYQRQHQVACGRRRQPFSRPPDTNQTWFGRMCCRYREPLSLDSAVVGSCVDLVRKPV